MGNYSKGANGTISGKFGSVIGSSWRGIDYLKGLPKKRSKQPSESQLAVQARFALTAAQLSPIKDILYIGFGDKKLDGLTGYNAAVKEFIANSILGEYPDYTVDYARMKLSRGSLLVPLKHIDMLLDAGMLTLNWTHTEKRNAFVDDTVIVVIYNKTTGLYDVDESAVRVDGTVTVDTDADLGDVLHVWLFCVKRDGTQASATQYAGTVTLTDSI